MFPARHHRLHWLRMLWGVVVTSLGLAAGTSTPAVVQVEHGAVSFRRDVMQLLSKAGCNAGACHGNANGKGGFKLSLRAEDAVADFRALVEEQGGRRINLLEPERSLILIKATAAIAHEGGQRFTNGSPAFLCLRDWLAAGAVDDRDGAPRLTRLEVSPDQIVLVEPAGEVTVRAIAHFADGSRRDVSREAVYETSNPFVHVSAEGSVRREQFGESVVLVRYLNQQRPVRIAFVPARPGFVWSPTRPVNYVDEQVFAKLPNSV